MNDNIVKLGAKLGNAAGYLLVPGVRSSILLLASVFMLGSVVQQLMAAGNVSTAATIATSALLGLHIANNLFSALKE